jgi:hypothetical protein
MSRSRILVVLLSVVAAASLAACTGNPAAPDAAPAAVSVAPAGDADGVLTASGRGNSDARPRPVIYVYGQGLYYDSIVTAESLPFRGEFQKLEEGGATGLQTEFGPGDKDYRGGRWWVDSNPNRYMDEEDTFFSCPLLGPGRETP